MKNLLMIFGKFSRFPLARILNNCNISRQTRLNKTFQPQENCMKISDVPINLNDKIRLSEAKIQLVQDGNTLGSTDETEILDISFENQLLGDETFMVLRSSTGWSIDAASDLTKILEQVHRVIEGVREFEV